MFKKISSSLLALALLAGLAAPASAQGAGGSFVIKQVYLRADGSMAMISGDGTNKNPDGCTGGTGMYVIERATLGDAAFDRMVAQLTAAHLANRRSEVWLNGCSRGSYWGGTRPVIWDFRINLD
jgi:hypothetical protein